VPHNTTVLYRDQCKGEGISTPERIYEVRFLGLTKGEGIDVMNGGSSIG
jgi:hypothetical protein